MGTSHQSATGPRAVERAVLRAIVSLPRMDGPELRRVVDADPAAVDRACVQLQRDGLVRVAGGDYALTARGERRLRTRHPY